MAADLGQSVSFFGVCLDELGDSGDVSFFLVDHAFQMFGEFSFHDGHAIGQSTRIQVHLRPQRPQSLKARPQHILDRD